MAKGKVIFAEDACKGCGLCTSVCPKGIVIMDETRLNAQGYNPAAVSDAEQCTGCASCALFCPDSVITVQRQVQEVCNG
jgi:2-oxoglutarate ferredoxin oxidoreductase subunit delta